LTREKSGYGRIACNQLEFIPQRKRRPRGYVRDDFSKQTVMDVARAVGYRCSNPECNQPTVGANAAQDGIVTIGVAAHICAASSGGPRYNAAQSREARRSKDNGIWLCQNCGRLV